MPSFKLKPEHIKIMTDLNFRISILIDSKDRYRPAIDVKRPFGNSGPTTNVCEIMGWHCDEESGEYAAEGHSQRCGHPAGVAEAGGCAERAG